jgi:hypothetical protein
MNFSTLQLEIAGVQESLRQNQAEMVQTQEDLYKRQEDQFRKLQLLLKFKETEFVDGNGRNGESNRNRDQAFQINSSRKAFETQPLRLDFPRIDGDDPEGWCYLSSQFYDYYDVNFNCTRKCTNHLQLMDCKCDGDPIGNCVFENKIYI